MSSEQGNVASAAGEGENDIDAMPSSKRESSVHFAESIMGPSQQPQCTTQRPSMLLDGKKKRESSLDLRKQIPDSLLLNDNSERAIIDDMSSSVAASKRRSSKFTDGGCFHRLFLNPTYPLRKQMLLTFGCVSSMTILLVMVVSIIASIATGNAVKEESNANIERWVDGFTGRMSRYVAEALSPKIMVSVVSSGGLDIS